MEPCEDRVGLPVARAPGDKRADRALRAPLMLLVAEQPGCPQGQSPFLCAANGSEPRGLWA